MKFRDRIRLAWRILTRKTPFGGPQLIVRSNERLSQEGIARIRAEFAKSFQGDRAVPVRVLDRGLEVYQLTGNRWERLGAEPVRGSDDGRSAVGAEPERRARD